MSLGIHLLARVPSPAPEQFLPQIERWLLQKHREMLPKTRLDYDISPAALLCQIHPAAEEFELTLIDQITLVARANTSVLGPGYHVFLTALLKDLAREFGASWQRPDDESEDVGDETGYFFSGDEQTLRDEMTRWLAAVANTFFDGTFHSDDRGIALCMPLNHEFETDQRALTNLGPRDEAWLARTAIDGGAGSDFFAWWNPGFNAGYYLGRALTQMWTDVRWRPSVNDSERVVLEDVATCLRRAFDLDPSLDYPWAEWSQILRCLGRRGAETGTVVSRAQGPPTIGYRRQNVNVTLPGGWRMKLPGSFSTFETDEQNNLSAVDPPREVWFTAYRSESSPLPGAFEATKKEIRDGTHGEYLIERDDYLAEATISHKQSETDEPYFLLSSSNRAPGKRSVCTIVFLNPNQKDWALATWRSIHPASDPET